ncbi:TetR/AcrR family transcriptional regulator [soil metagenome]|jgi:AcrR family transcriptional regulator
MPKIVDHEERRRELAEAVWRVILRDGVEGVSVRNVAAEAGWSTGALRHYVGTKEELLASATQLLEERVRSRFEIGRYDGTPREVVRGLLCEVLPLDEERRTEGSLWFAFAARSMVDPRIAQEYEVVFDGVRELCRRAIHRVAEGGWLVSGLDNSIEAASLHALVDGLAVHGLMGRLDEEQMLSVLDAHLSRIIRDP